MYERRKELPNRLTAEHKRGALPFSYLKVRNWREEVKGYCPCFSGTEEPFGLITTPCKNPSKTFKYLSGCPAYHFRRCLSLEEKPSVIELVTSLLRMGAFIRVQLVFAVFEMFKCSYPQSGRRVEACLQLIRKGKIKGKLLKGDDNKLTLIQRDP